MKLSINLADREEIAAAVPLLQLILAGAYPEPVHVCGGHCHSDREPEVPLAPSGAPVLVQVPAMNPAAIAAEISQDPAVVFGGGAQPAVPLPPAGAPSIAGAAPLPIALEATKEITSGATLSAPVPPVPAAPVTVAPTVLGAAPSTPASSVELDKNGLPWDERIHASTKTKIASGEWKAKRGVEPALVAQVEAELRARAPVFGGAAPGVPLAPATPTAPPAAFVMTPALGAAGTTVPSAPTGAAAPETFEQLMPRVTAAVTSGVLTPAAVTTACAAHGVASIVALQQSPQFVPHVWATLKQQNPELA